MFPLYDLVLDNKASCHTHGVLDQSYLVIQNDNKNYDQTFFHLRNYHFFINDILTLHSIVAHFLGL